MFSIKWWTLPRVSVVVTLILTALASWLALWSIRTEEYLYLAVSVGAIGGLIHEFAQSGGKVLYIVSAKDGFYLGTVSGMVLGAVAGLLVLKGQLVLLENPATDVNVYEVTLNVFFAGLGLKGVAEAATGERVDKSEE
ncbi:MAG: hypothetical protein HY562_09230 [Ignavibacteriales bacterium]|nr:hypothetical protein [Ignavibacteriales bacterium]